MTEVRILSSASQYKEFIFQGVTGLHASDENFSFDVTDWDQDGIADVLLVKKQFTGTGTTEVHVLSGVSRFKQFILHTGTALGPTDHRFQFFVAERPGFKPRRRSSYDGSVYAGPSVWRPQSGVTYVIPPRREIQQAAKPLGHHRKICRRSFFADVPLSREPPRLVFPLEKVEATSNRLLEPKSKDQPEDRALRRLDPHKKEEWL